MTGPRDLPSTPLVLGRPNDLAPRSRGLALLPSDAVLEPGRLPDRPGPVEPVIISGFDAAASQKRPFTIVCRSPPCGRVRFGRIALDHVMGSYSGPTTGTCCSPFSSA